MNFGSGVIVGLGIGLFSLILSLFMMCSGTLNKEDEAYRKGYEDGINSVKDEEDN